MEEVKLNPLEKQEIADLIALWYVFKMHMETDDSKQVKINFYKMFEGDMHLVRLVNNRINTLWRQGYFIAYFDEEGQTFSKVRVSQPNGTDISKAIISLTTTVYSFGDNILKKIRSVLAYFSINHLYRLEHADGLDAFDSFILRIYGELDEMLTTNKSTSL